MIKGITFDSQQISAANMGHFMNVFSGKQSGITQGCAITYDSDNLYIAPGYLLLCGRQVQIVGTQTVPLETVVSGELFCKTVFQIELSQTNTTSTFLQGTIETLTSASGYPAVQQDDIDNGGIIYQWPIAQYHVTVSGADSVVDLTESVSVNWIDKSKFTLNTSTNTLTIDLT